jgi:predicted porin
MIKNHRRALQIVILAFVFTALAYAQAPAPTPTSNVGDLLEVLHAKGILSQQEYDALKQRVVTVAPAPKAQEVPASAQKTAEPFVRMMDSGVGLHIGEVDLKFSGELNAFFVHDRPAISPNGAVGGLASSGQVPNSSIRNGLLPSNFSINVSTRQRGLDIGATFGFYPGLNSLGTTTPGGVNFNAGQPTGFGVSGIDFRQQFVTVGNKHIGTFKLGRDIGFFGQEAILNDMTILAVGTPNGNAAPGSVSLGRIGVGYTYTDFIPQISYMTPSMGGFQAGFGVFTPLDASIGSPTLSGHGQPMYQAKLTYAVPTKGPVKATLFVNGITQSLQANLGEALARIPDRQSVRAAGFDGGVKLTVGPANLFAYGYNGRGTGQEGLFFFATDSTGHPREFRGGYLQGTYTLAKKTTLGFSWGLSHAGLTPTDNFPNLVKTNSSEVGQIRYALTKWVTPIAEYTHTSSTAHDSSHVWTDDSVALGAIVFF